MAQTERLTRKTMSRCNPETERCTHILEIAGYSLHKNVNPSCYIESAAFAVGGHEWCIRFYPNGDGWEDTEGFEDSVSIYLVLMGEATEVRALFDFRMVGAATGVSTSVHAEDRVFSSDCLTWGAGNLMQKMDDLGELLDSEVGADVMFTVKSEVFHAHKIVLAMRSPVFMAELYGPMSDKEMKTITIEDMQPSVFKALLHFIYKDSLPLMDDLDTFEDEEMVKHLLVAADRYGIDRMKVMCESILGKRLCIGSVASTLALADQHHCIQLKDACIEFINSSNRSGDVFASQGYAHLKRACPAVIVEIWEKSAKTPRFILDT
ncbi:unnamed protein product [Urochloa decumbens]|uniref:Uncharacterized protein n=1 Tax=Urochloa decumbens TaxID=240449 RepID=A0ABC9BUW7_9POAL